jgi:hypothetical protein
LPAINTALVPIATITWKTAQRLFKRLAESQPLIWKTGRLRPVRLKFLLCQHRGQLCPPLGQQRNQHDGTTNQNSAKQNKALRLVLKPNKLGQRTGTGAEATGQLVGTKKARAPRPMLRRTQNEATKIPLTKHRAEVHARRGRRFSNSRPFLCG